MNYKFKIALLIIISIAAVVLCIGIGSVYISPEDIFSILGKRLFGAALPSRIPESYVPLVLDMRIPRVLTAYLTGAALSLSGAVMQSLLQNPLASPYGLGVSAGAGLGAALAIVLGLSAPLLSALSLVFALLTILLVSAISARLDRSFSNTTIILIGMVVSLFCTALMSFAASYNPDFAQRIQLFTLGSFSMKEWSAVFTLLPAVAAAFMLFMYFSKEADIMSFGDAQAASMGVNAPLVKKILLAAASALTGIAVSLVGIIGFVDLVVPHIARKIAGASARNVLPVCALSGGIFLVFCDLGARTLALPREIPIGVITALLGAPFFIYIFFVIRKRG